MLFGKTRGKVFQPREHPPSPNLPPASQPAPPPLPSPDSTQSKPKINSPSGSKLLSNVPLATATSRLTINTNPSDERTLTNSSGACSTQRLPHTKSEGDRAGKAKSQFCDRKGRYEKGGEGTRTGSDIVSEGRRGEGEREKDAKPTSVELAMAGTRSRPKHPPLRPLDSTRCLQQGRGGESSMGIDTYACRE